MSTRSNHISEETKKWQTLYTANKEHWDDMERSSQIQTPIILKTLFIITYIFMLLFLKGWISEIKWTQKTILETSVVAIIALLPVIFSFWRLSQLSQLGQRFFEDFYKPPENLTPTIKQLIKNRVQGIPPAPPILQSFISSLEYPYVIIPENGVIKPEQKWIKWLGGPANLVISDGIALYLERGNKFSRVVGSGIIHLERYETVRAIVQLTPQKKDAEQKISTKDGIPITLKARMVFQVGLNHIVDSVSDKRMYPLDPLAVKLAVEKTTLRYVENAYQESHWYDSVWGQVNGPLVKYITSHGLDEFFVTDIDRENTLPELVQKRLFDEVSPKLALFGVRLLELQITEIKPPKEIDKQRMENWEATRESIAKIKEGENIAYQTRGMEIARAIAQRNLILTIAEGLDKMDQEHLDESLLMSLSAILDHSLNDPSTRLYVTSDALNTLENLKKLL